LHNNIYLNIIYFPVSIDFFYLKNNFLLLGIDGISLFLVLLTTFLFLICCFIAENIRKYVTLFFTLFLFLEIFILLAFLVLDFLWFYVFFEALLIPMFLIIGIWGSRKRKLKAANYFLFFAFFGSLFMLIGIFIIYNLVGSTS
jgi:NADH:ubiquinone oxidoreductase subunit 4 (subunit M)